MQLKPLQLFQFSLFLFQTLDIDVFKSCLWHATVKLAYKHMHACGCMSCTWIKDKN